MLINGCLSDYIHQFIGIINEETKEKTLWEFWLHKVFDQSYSDFIAQNESKDQDVSTSMNLEAAISNSFGIINNFRPEE